MNEKLFKLLTEKTEFKKWHTIGDPKTVDDIRKMHNDFSELGLAIQFSPYNRELKIFLVDTHIENTIEIKKIISEIQQEKASKIVPIGATLREIIQQSELNQESIELALAILVFRDEINEHCNIKATKIYYIK